MPGSWWTHQGRAISVLGITIADVLDRRGVDVDPIRLEDELFARPGAPGSRLLAPSQLVDLGS